MPEFITKTRDQILADYLRDIRLGIAGADTREGSNEYARGTALATALMPLYLNAKRIADDSFPATASEEGLRRWGTLFSRPRKDATFAAGVITVTSSFATTIPDGARLTNQAVGTKYRVVGAIAIGASLSASAYVVAITPGPSGACDVGTILTFDGAPPGINPQATVVSMSGGEDAWDNARWATEIFRRMRSAPRGGNFAHYQALASAMGGVEQAFVYGAVRGAGTVDVVLTTSEASGTRVASNALLARYSGALSTGVRTPEGETIPGLAADQVASTRVMSAVEQPTNIVVKARASAANPWGAWPPIVDSTNTSTWYMVTASTSLTTMTVTKPTSPVTPIVGQSIGMFFPSVGFAMATITSVTTNASDWSVSTTSWTPTPTETTVPLDVVHPWCSQLPLLVGAHVDPSLALSGAIADYFAALGPGEQVVLTSADTWKRRRDPVVGSINPLTGDADFPTDLTSRLAKVIVDATDFVDASFSVRSGSYSTPTIGIPPRILTLGTVAVFPY